MQPAMSDPGDILSEQSGKVTTLTLSRAGKHNALNQRMRSQLVERFSGLENDASTSVVVVTGDGEKAFCAGADVTEFLGRTSLQQWERDLDPNRVFEVIERFPKPVIAMVNGYAFGGGCELALACDIRLSNVSAQFGLLETRFNLIPGGGGTQRLARLVGRGQAMRLVLAAERISAREAERIGLVERVVTDEALRRVTMELAERIAKVDPVALRCAKASILSADEMPLATGLGYEAALMGMESKNAKGEIEDFLKGKSDFTE
jgi:enoyl-CoA hydratase